MNIISLNIICISCIGIGIGISISIALSFLRCALISLVALD
jgi:hypothetical protein